MINHFTFSLRYPSLRRFYRESAPFQPLPSLRTCEITLMVAGIKVAGRRWRSEPWSGRGSSKKPPSYGVILGHPIGRVCRVKKFIVIVDPDGRQVVLARIRCFRILENRRRTFVFNPQSPEGASEFVLFASFTYQVQIVPYFDEDDPSRRCAVITGRLDTAFERFDNE